MLSKRAVLPTPLPRWVVALGSLLVALHLGAILVLVLSAPSGPWLSPFGPSQALGPTFATLTSEVANRYYLQPLRMMHNFHYQGNRVDGPDVQFDVALRNENGDLIETLHFPSAKDNAWVRFRQGLLAQGLAGDVPAPLPRGEEIPAKGAEMEKVTVWRPVPGEKKLIQTEVEKHLVKDLARDLPREAQLMKPQDWSLLLVRAYGRYLCRRHGAATAQVTRNSRDAVSPALLFLPQDNLPPGTFDTLVSQFEGTSREN